MSTIYEVNSSTLGQLQIVKDMVFGWCIRTASADLTFQPITELSPAELSYLKMVNWPAYIPDEFKQKIASLLNEKKAVAAQTSKPKPTPEATTRPPVNDPILDSHRQISLDILVKAKVVDGVLTADLGYVIYRGGYVNGQCTVESVSVKKGEITSFKNAQEAVAHIARKWW